MSTFACFGLSFLGQCSYDPATPISYFTLGDAVAAVAVTTGLQQFMKPIFVLRLRSQFMSLRRIYALIFFGVACVIVAAIVPSLSALHGLPFGYAIDWEILATIAFVIAYGSIASAIVWPVRVRPGGMRAFANEVATYLSFASEDQHLELRDDIQGNLVTIVRSSKFLEDLSRTDPPSAHFDFIHRREMEDSSFARSLLMIMADAPFCRTLVVRSPWFVARLVRDLEEAELHSDAAEVFVHELAHQAILNDDGILSRELGYRGFGVAPLLSDALFGSRLIVGQYDPLSTYINPDLISPPVFERLNFAVRKSLDTLAVAKHFRRAQVIYSIKRLYETAFLKAWTLRKGDRLEYPYVSEMKDAVEVVTKAANAFLDAAGPLTYNGWFQAKDGRRHYHPVEVLADGAFDMMSLTSSALQGGHEDILWYVALDAVGEPFSRFGDPPPGLTPFQQLLLLKIDERLKENMKGHYGSLVKILLLGVGPYGKRTGKIDERSAFSLLEDILYGHLKNGLAELHKKDPAEIEKLLPKSIEYDSESQSLTRTYASGERSTTVLPELKIDPPDLYEKSLFRERTAGEKKEAGEN